MATNASLVLTCTQSSQDIANNKSTVTISVKCQLKNGVAFSNAGIKTNVSVTCDGQTKTFAAPTSYNVGANGSLTLGSASFTVSHASDGKKSISFSASWTPPYLYGGGTATGSGSKTLTTIPRTSSFTIPGSCTLGSAFTISITRASANFTHKIYYYIGSSWVLVASDVATSYSWTPPLSLASSFTNVSSFTMKIGVDTYSGSTKIGATNKAISTSIPSSIAPTVSAPSIARVDNGVPSAWGIWVKGFSKANVSITGSGSYGSSISSYTLSGGGYYTASSSLSTGVFSTSGTITFTGQVTDSRGRSKSASSSITVYDYTTPSVTIKAERCNANGVADSEGAYANVTATFSIASVNGKNTVASKKVEIVGTSYSNTSFNSGAVIKLGGALSTDKSYVAKVTVTDALGKSSTAQVTIPTGEVIMDFKANGKGVAFGKVAETDNLVDSAWGVKCTSLNVTSTEWGALKTAGCFYAPSAQINGASWVCTQLSSTGRLGFYDKVGGTRKGWIGHDGKTDFFIVNEAGGNIVMSNSTKFNGVLLNNNGAEIMNPNYEYFSIGYGFHTAGKKTVIYGKEVDIVNAKNTQIMWWSDTNASWNGYYAPNKDNVALGTTTYRWNRLYAAVQPNISSDIRLKQNIRSYDSRYEKMYMDLKPCLYELKSDPNVTHNGMIAQWVKQSMDTFDISENEFALYDYDKESDTYGLVYGELTTLNTHMIQKTIKVTDDHEDRIQKLEDKTRKLEQENAELRSKLNALIQGELETELIKRTV